VDAKLLITNYKNFKMIKADYKKMPEDLDWADGHPPNFWIYGPTRTGKSFYARKTLFAGQSFYIKNAANKWWDKYDDQEYVLIEDIDTTHHYQGYYLKIWADKYAFRAEVKGGTVNLRPPVIAVTSQYLPMDIFKDDALCQAIQRRFKIITIRDVDDHYRAQGLQNLREWATLHDALQGPIHGEPVV